MAIRYAVATGNWSNVATWDGGASLPTAGDDVYANGYTVSVDQDITVAKISTEVCPTTLIEGGGFSLTKTTTQILTCNIVAGATRCAITSTAVQIYVIGDIYGGYAASAFGLWLNATTTGTVGNAPIIIGNLYAGSNSTTYALTSRSDRSYSPNITGNVFASTASIAISVITSTSAILILTGNATAELSSQAISTGYIDATGIFTASATSPAIYYGSGIAIISGQLINNSGVLAVLGGSISSKLFLKEIGTLSWKFNTTGSDRTLYPSTTLENPPAESDVRAGVVYGIGDAYEGTLETGSTPAEFVAALVASDLGLRMAKCAVTEEVLTMLENFE